jgi:hypothetical protein
VAEIRKHLTFLNTFLKFIHGIKYRSLDNISGTQLTGIGYYISVFLESASFVQICYTGHKMWVLQTPTTLTPETFPLGERHCYVQMDRHYGTNQ